MEGSLEQTDAICTGYMGAGICVGRFGIVESKLRTRIACIMEGLRF
jgi:hypothetical protein